MPTPPASVPLNVFQQLMRRWDAVHPYNAAQAIRLRGPADLPRLEAAWQSALSATGLGAVAFAGRRYRFEPAGQPAGVRQCAASLAEHVSAELNRPFADPAEPPLRPFVLPADDVDGEPTHYAGVVYQHWLADSAAIRLLMGEWFARAFAPQAADGRPLRLPGDDYGRAVCGGRDAVDVLGGLLASARRHCRLRRVQKVASRNLSDRATRFALVPAEPGLITSVRAAAAARGVKVNDLFLATLAEASAAHVPLQRRPRRTDVAVGSIVDLRPLSRVDLSRTFGLYLGFTNVAAGPAELRDFEQLVRTIATQTRQQKAAGVAGASLTWMSAALLLGRLGKPDELYHFYRKELPLAAGISNVDLTPTWVGRDRTGRVLDYVRVSPTGPMAPLAMTTTTLGDRFHLGLTYRTGLIDPARAAEIAGAVLGRLRTL